MSPCPEVCDRLGSAQASEALQASWAGPGQVPLGPGPWDAGRPRGLGRRRSRGCLGSTSVFIPSLSPSAGNRIDQTH